jgi:tRNA(Ile)-lysidine synthase
VSEGVAPGLDLPERIREFIRRYELLAPGERVVLGVSGGADSLCLLDSLLRLGQDVVVAHLNHQLRGAEADADARFVEGLAAERGLQYYGDRRDVGALARQRNLGLEEAARQARYSFLTEVARAAQASNIAVGHNADDQVETVLMHFLRGTGLAGLRGMLPATPLGQYRFLGAEAAAGLTLVRPLLEVPRSDINAYCRRRSLSPRFDSSNLDLTFYRNRLRHELLPFLETFNPGIRSVLQHTAQLALADHALLQDQVGPAWNRVVRGETEEAITVDLGAWRGLTLSLRRSILRRAIQSIRPGLRNVDFGHIERAVTDLMRAESGHRITLPSHLQVVVDYDTFVVGGEDYSRSGSNVPRLLTVQPLPVAIPGLTALADTTWRLRAELLADEQVSTEIIRRASGWRCFLDADVVGRRPLLRCRLPGDLFQPLGMAGHSTRVNEFMINAKISRFERSGVPLLICESGDIGWLCGWRVDHRARVRPQTRRVLQLSFESAAETGGFLKSDG